MITVRAAAEADAQALAELNHDFNGVRRGAHEIRDAMQATASQESTLVADESGAVVGFLCFQALRSVCYDGPWVEITELYVVPTYRGSGAGRALVEDAIRRAEEAGASEVVLRTNSRNSAAQNLFGRIGLEAAPQMVFRTVCRGAANKRLKLPAQGAGPRLGE